MALDHMEKLLKRYLDLKEHPIKLRDIIQPSFVLNVIVLIPMFVG